MSQLNELVEENGKQWTYDGARKVLVSGAIDDLLDVFISSCAGKTPPSRIILSLTNSDTLTVNHLILAHRHFFSSVVFMAQLISAFNRAKQVVTSKEMYQNAEIRSFICSHVDWSYL